MKRSLGLRCVCLLAVMASLLLSACHSAKPERVHQDRAEPINLPHAAPTNDRGRLVDAIGPERIELRIQYERDSHWWSHAELTISSTPDDPLRVKYLVHSRTSIPASVSTELLKADATRVRTPSVVSSTSGPRTVLPNYRWACEGEFNIDTSTLEMGWGYVVITPTYKPEDKESAEEPGSVLLTIPGGLMDLFRSTEGVDSIPTRPCSTPYAEGSPVLSSEDLEELYETWDTLEALHFQISTKGSWDFPEHNIEIGISLIDEGLAKVTFRQPHPKQGNFDAFLLQNIRPFVEEHPDDDDPKADEVTPMIATVIPLMKYPGGTCFPSVERATLGMHHVSGPSPALFILCDHSTLVVVLPGSILKYHYFPN